MNQTVDIRELNARIESKSSFVDAITMGMNKMIVGQNHFGGVFIDRIALRRTHPVRGCSRTCQNFSH